MVSLVLALVSLVLASVSLVLALVSVVLASVSLVLALVSLVLTLVSRVLKSNWQSVLAHNGLNGHVPLEASCALLVELTCPSLRWTGPVRAGNAQNYS